MIGRISGVATRMKAHSPRMLAVHCVNHRLALAAAHAADGIPYLQRFKSILQTLFYFFQNSCVRTASLHANDPVLKCKQAKHVRWLSHDLPIKAVIRTLLSLLVCLEHEASQDNEPTAQGLLKFMKCYKFVACAYLLSDILPHLSRLSYVVQKQDVDLSLIRPCLKTAIDSIEQHKSSPGANFSKLDNICATDLKAFDISPTESEKQEFKCSIQQVHRCNCS